MCIQCTALLAGAAESQISLASGSLFRKDAVQATLRLSVNTIINTVQVMCSHSEKKPKQMWLIDTQFHTIAWFLDGELFDCDANFSFGSPSSV